MYDPKNGETLGSSPLDLDHSPSDTLDGMKDWNCILLPLLLACYIAASGIAVAHAFPPPFDGKSEAYTGVETAGMQIADMEIKNTMYMFGCHRQKTSDSPSGSLSACDIFCSAMSNIIANDDVADWQLSKVNIQIMFTGENFRNPVLAMEPHPPK